MIRNFLKFNFKSVAVLGFLIVVGLCTIAYMQYQAYQEKKEQQARKALIENLVNQARKLAEENRKHPLILPPDPLAPAEDPLGRTPPSDAEEMANINLWHKSTPAQRKKLSLAEKPQTPSADAVQHIAAGSSAAKIKAMPEEADAVDSADGITQDSVIPLQVVQEMQKKALTIKH